jgi:hypothetical protein
LYPRSSLWLGISIAEVDTADSHYTQQQPTHIPDVGGYRWHFIFLSSGIDNTSTNLHGRNVELIIVLGRCGGPGAAGKLKDGVEGVREADGNHQTLLQLSSHGGEPTTNGSVWGKAFDR